MDPRTDKHHTPGGSASGEHLDEQRPPVGLHRSDESISDESIELDRRVDVTCDDHAGRADLAITKGWDVPARSVRELVATLDARGGHPRLGELIAWRGITARAAVLLAPGADESRAVRYLEATQHIARRMAPGRDL